MSFLLLVDLKVTISRPEIHGVCVFQGHFPNSCSKYAVVSFQVVYISLGLREFDDLANGLAIFQIFYIYINNILITFTRITYLYSRVVI